MGNVKPECLKCFSYTGVKGHGHYRCYADGCPAYEATRPFRGCFSNNIIAGFDFTKREPLIFQRADGTIVANMDGCAIIPKDEYERLTAK